MERKISFDIYRKVAFKYSARVHYVSRNFFSFQNTFFNRIPIFASFEATRADLLQVTFNYAYTTDLIQTLEGKQLG